MKTLIKIKRDRVPIYIHEKPVYRVYVRFNANTLQGKTKDYDLILGYYSEPLAKMLVHISQHKKLFV